MTALFTTARREFHKQVFKKLIRVDKDGVAAPGPAIMPRGKPGAEPPQ